MGAKLRVGEQEPLAQALRRFRRLVARRDSFEKWYRRARRAGRYHAQLLLESRERSRLHDFLDSWLPAVEQLKAARAVRWSLDVDPLELF